MKIHAMKINVILTFNVRNPLHRSQEWFDINLDVREDEDNAYEFIDRELFPKIVSKCKELKLNHENIYTISTCGDWKTFEDVTGKPGLDCLGHSCKWYFGPEDEYVGEWGIEIRETSGIGKKVKKLWFKEWGKPKQD